MRRGSPRGRERIGARSTRLIGVEGPAPYALGGQQAAETQPGKVSSGDGDVAAFELAGVGRAHAVGELLVDVHDEVELVVHQLQRAVDHVAEQHGAFVTVGDDDNTAAGRV